MIIGVGISTMRHKHQRQHNWFVEDLAVCQTSLKCWFFCFWQNNVGKVEQSQFLKELFVATFPFYETQNFWLSLNSFMEMKKPSEKTWLFHYGKSLFSVLLLFDWIKSSIPQSFLTTANQQYDFSQDGIGSRINCLCESPYRNSRHNHRLPP